MKFLVPLSALFLFVSCASQTTTPPFSVSSENAWFLEQDVSNHRTKPMYCMADVKDGKARPKCYRSSTIQNTEK